MQVEKLPAKRCRVDMRSPPIHVLLPGCPWRPWLPAYGPIASRFGHEKADDRGRVRVTLRVGHPYANSAGWQYRYRLLVAFALGRLPRSDEHVDHLREGCSDDDLLHLRLILAEYHGRDHAFATELAGGRSADGRFQELEKPLDTEPASRDAAVITALAWQDPPPGGVLRGVRISHFLGRGRGCSMRLS